VHENLKCHFFEWREYTSVSINQTVNHWLVPFSILAAASGETDIYNHKPAVADPENCGIKWGHNHQLWTKL